MKKILGVVFASALLFLLISCASSRSRTLDVNIYGFEPERPFIFTNRSGHDVTVVYRNFYQFSIPAGGVRQITPAYLVNVEKYRPDFARLSGFRYGLVSTSPQGLRVWNYNLSAANNGYVRQEIIGRNVYIYNDRFRDPNLYTIRPDDAVMISNNSSYDIVLKFSNGFQREIEVNRRFLLNPIWLIDIANYMPSEHDDYTYRYYKIAEFPNDVMYWNYNAEALGGGFVRLDPDSHEPVFIDDIYRDPEIFGFRPELIRTITNNSTHDITLHLKNNFNQIIPAKGEVVKLSPIWFVDVAEYQPEYFLDTTFTNFGANTPIGVKYWHYYYTVAKNGVVEWDEFAPTPTLVNQKVRDPNIYSDNPQSEWTFRNYSSFDLIFIFDNGYRIRLTKGAEQRISVNWLIDVAKYNAAEQNDANNVSFIATEFPSGEKYWYYNIQVSNNGKVKRGSSEMGTLTYINDMASITDRKLHTSLTTDATRGLRIETATESALLRLLNHIPDESTVAVLNISTFDVDLATSVTNQIVFYLLDSENYHVIERSTIERLNIQRSSEMSDITATTHGRAVGADFVINGRLTGAEFDEQIIIQVLDVNTGRVINRQMEFVNR